MAFNIRGIRVYHHGSFTVANLPTAASHGSKLELGDSAYATNGRRAGEGAGAGTGVRCTWCGSPAAWKAEDTGATAAS
jgi:hypothetical protein